jgi:hypothetical protein
MSIKVASCLALALCVTMPTAVLAQPVQRDSGPDRGKPLTAKEKLSGKAADEQRVDDCKVPPAQRTRTDRPTECAPTAQPAPATAQRK